jgi:hypothetical protein
MLPTFSYEQLVTTLEPQPRHAAWLELGELLAERPGWRFELNPDALLSWTYHAAAAWVSVDSSSTSATFVLWQQRSEDDDDVAYWERTTLTELVALTECLETGKPLVALPTYQPASVDSTAALA